MICRVGILAAGLDLENVYGFPDAVLTERFVDGFAHGRLRGQVLLGVDPGLELDRHDVLADVAHDHYMLAAVVYSVDIPEGFKDYPAYKLGIVVGGNVEDDVA